ncbi:MAG: hypothetical protein QOG63_2721 [Thermoleophilaceae bacterium]|nr:hypothetical protein [Thermoleophilaceae bacterium]
MRGKLNSEPAYAFALLATTALIGAGCGGGSHFENAPRPPSPVQLTGVIRDDKVTVSPNRVGAGPIILLISNQTQQAHTITLDGGSVNETVGPINPLDTAKVQQTLGRGSYQVKAGSKQAVAKEISPATLDIGPSRKSSRNELLLP